MVNEIMNGLTVALPFIVGVGATGGILKTGYVKASPDDAYIISGLRKEPKILIGKAGIKIPFFEKLDKLSLKLIPLDIKTGDSVPTADCINVFVDSAVNVKIGSSPEMVKIASQNFLNKSINEIGDIVAEVLEGNIREIICTMNLRELIGDRKLFVERVSENVVPDLEKMGLELVTFNVQRFYDENHIIEDLGIDNIAQIQKSAKIAKANADKEVEIAQARAEKEANDARVQAETEIAIKQNELEIKRAELKKESDIKQAEADAAYQIQEEEQRKTIEITTANANLARQEKEIELKEREVAIKERLLDAEVRKTAEAEKYAAEQKADAELYKIQKASEAELFERQRKAEADKFEAEQQAEAVKAESEAKRVAMENEAAGIEAKGKAEAEAIRAKAEAEAVGILKKAEAMERYGEAAMADMKMEALKLYFEQLPEIAQAIAAPMANIDSITMYGEGNTAKLTGDITTTMKQITDGVKDATGIDPMAMLAGLLGGKIATFDAE